MTELDEVLGVPELDGGATVLVHGPPMIGKRERVVQGLAATAAAGDCVVVTTTDVDATEVFAELETYVDQRTLDRVGIVDCTGGEQTDDDHRIAYASSPADLTGIGVGISELLADLHDTYEDPTIHAMLDSLSTVFLYSGSDRVLQFVHILGQRVSETGGVGILLAHSDGDDTTRGMLETLVDGVVEMRLRDDDLEARTSGFAGAATDWHRLTSIETSPDAAEPAESSGDGDIGDVAASIASTVTANQESSGWLRELDDEIESLGALIARIDEERPTLSVYNYDGDESTLSDLETHCETMNVGFRVDTLPHETPRNLAVLHRGEDVIDVVQIQSLLNALGMEETNLEAFEDATPLDAITDLSRSTFGARGASKEFLIDISHVIEMTASRTGVGELHAGFQQLSNCFEDSEARRIYQRLAESGVEVHVYGAPDVDPPDIPGITVHAETSDEIANSWFVAYDGAGDPQDAATLLVEQRAPDTYHGFWTYDAGISGDLLSYLGREYPERQSADVRGDSDRNPPTA